MEIGGWVIRPWKGNRKESLATYIIQFDIMGSIPAKIRQTLNLRQPLAIAVVKKMMLAEK